MIGQISEPAIFFQNYIKRLLDCLSLGEYLWANINVSNFIGLYLQSEANLLKFHSKHALCTCFLI